jgi:hypothetical protein
MRDCITEQMTAIRRGFSLVLRDCPQDKYEVQLPRTTKVGFGMSINQDGVVTKWRDPDPRPVVMEEAPSAVTLQVSAQQGVPTRSAHSTLRCVWTYRDPLLESMA